MRKVLGMVAAICLAISASCSPRQAQAPLDGNLPIIIPHPWQAEWLAAFRAPRIAVAAMVAGDPPVVKKTLVDALCGAGIALGGKDDTVCNENRGILRIAFHASPATITAADDRALVTRDWSNLPDQGYVLLVRGGARPRVIIAGRSPAARLYALQTLRQITGEGKGRELRACHIVDFPELDCRGMAMGLHWFRKFDKAVERLAAMKCNYIYNTGSYMNQKFGGKRGRWRESFTQDELAHLARYLKTCRHYLIEPCLAFGPRGKPPTTYSDRKTSDILNAKIDQLYGIGFRSFALSFDDLQNIGQDVLITSADKKAYRNIGEAHLDLVSRVYAHVKSLSGASLTIIPLWYQSFDRVSPEQRTYLETLSRLPGAVDFVYCEATPAGLGAFSRAMRRKRYPIIWDNYFARWSDAGIRMTFLPPIKRPAGYSRRNLGCYIVLPPTPGNEDPGLSSWSTMADYMWAPGRYDASASMQRAVIRKVGREHARIFLAYADFIGRASSFAPAVASKAACVRSLDKQISRIRDWEERLAPLANPEMRGTIHAESESSIRQLTALREDVMAKPFPVMVLRARVAPVIDGQVRQDPGWRNVTLISRFVDVKTARPAPHQTRCRMSYDNKYLYCAFVCMEDRTGDIHAEVKGHDKGVFRDECMEIFLDTNQDRETYVHVAANVLGTVYDARHLDRGWFRTRDLKWDIDARVAVRILPDRWCMEVALPLAALGGRKPAPGVRWNFNLGRERHLKPAEFSTYARLMKKGFHDPRRFWVLEFGE